MTGTRASGRVGLTGTTGKPRVLIEEWLPAAAIGVECIRERSTGQQPPDKRLHVWWARRPLTAARAAVLGSLLPADFPRDVFERLLGFGLPSGELVRIRRLMDAGVRIPGGFGVGRAFTRELPDRDLDRARAAMRTLWGDDVAVIDPMAGGGSIPLEAARLGLRSLANEYNPVACSVLEATTDYPFRYGPELGRARPALGTRMAEAHRTEARQVLSKTQGRPRACVYLRAHRAVPGHRPRDAAGSGLVAAQAEGRAAGGGRTGGGQEGRAPGRIRVREVGEGRGQLRQAPLPTYKKGKGVSLFSGNLIPAEYIKAKAQAGEMGSRLYAVAVKTPQGLTFEPPEQADLDAIDVAAKELAKHRTRWERENVIPTERIPAGDKTGEPLARGIPTWADMFSARQLLGMGVLVEELRALRAGDREDGGRRARRGGRASAGVCD